MKRTGWKRVIKEYEALEGEITQTGFCRERSISLSSFKYYLTVLRKKAPPEKPGGKFIEARIEPIASVSEDLRLRIREGVELFIPSGFDDSCLKRVLRGLL